MSERITFCVLWGICCLIATTAVIFLTSNLNRSEIEASSYEEIYDHYVWCRYDPGVHKLMGECIADDKITVQEYKELMTEFKDAQKRLFKNQLKR